MIKKRGVSQTEEDHAFAKRQAAACPALPANLQLGDQPFKDYEWNWIVENACAAAIPTALPTPKTRTETRLVGCVRIAHARVWLNTHARTIMQLQSLYSL